MDKPRIFHLRYGVIEINYNKERYTIAAIDTEDYPIVFLRVMADDPVDGGDYYTLYDNALTMEQATEILEYLSAGNTRKAGSLLKRYLKVGDPCCENVGSITLDDMIPDEWYDVWKEMEWIIISTGHTTYYRECEVKEHRSFD